MEANELSDKVWNDVNTPSENYTLKMDIIYEGNIDYYGAPTYREFVFWNGTTFTTDNNR